MAQQSIAFAAAKVQMLKSKAFDKQQVERLLNTGSLNEAKRVLTEIGFAESENIDYETASERYVLKACKAVNSLTTEPEVTDCYMLRFDAHNLKVLFKARHLNISQQFLFECGTIDIEKISRAVSNRQYFCLPKALKKCMNKLEKTMLVNFDPMMVDIEIDKAMYTEVFSKLKKNTPIYRYFQYEVSASNLITLFRTRKMGKNSDFYIKTLIEGGIVNTKSIINSFDNIDRLPSLFRVFGTGMVEAIRKYNIGQGDLISIERERDNMLLSMFKPYKYNYVNIEALFAYLIATQRQASAVRLAMAAKSSNFSAEAVKERMRDLNVG